MITAGMRCLHLHMDLEEGAKGIEVLQYAGNTYGMDQMFEFAVSRGD